MTAPDGRYRWHVDVTDAFGRPVVVWLGAENGKVITSTPRWFEAVPAQAYLLSAAYTLALEMAQEQQRKMQEGQQ